MRNILKNRSFLFVWMGTASSELGGAFGTFCNSILIYQLTGSTLALSSMWLLYFIPSLVLQLFIGPFIDRWSRKWTMIISQWMRGLVFLLPLLALTTESLQPWHIFAVQMAVGLITPLYTPASQALTPTIVPTSQLHVANAYLDGTLRLMTFLAPVTGGLVADYFGVKPTLTAVSLLLFSSGFLLLFIQENRVAEKIRKSWISQFTEGMVYFFKQPVIVWLGVFLAFVQFGVGVTMVITLPYITGELAGTYAHYGYFMASFPLGYVIGSFMVGRIKVKSRRFLMLGALTVGGMTFFWLGFNYSIYAALLTEGIAGIAMAIFNIHNLTISQQAIPSHLMGKVFSVRLFIIRGAMPLGVLAGGILSEMWGIRPLYILIGTIISTVSIVGMTHPYFKFLDGRTAKGKVA
ncbi:MFS transporter [Sutcliffiella sp. NPDC057660]|uniref:MFS transporter n=1 Tax=Sutcliffiella sp. NPDC057660 TaxID=3346199 RepID=UPI0036B0A310